MNWISVKVKKPDLFQPVMVYRSGDGTRFAFGWRGTDKRTWYDLSTEEGPPTLSGVTHWQPMPEVPGEKKKGQA